MIDPDFLKEVLLHMNDRFEQKAKTICDGVGIPDYATYRQLVGDLNGIREAVDVFKEIANRWGTE